MRSAHPAHGIEKVTGQKSPIVSIGVNHAAAFAKREKSTVPKKHHKTKRTTEREKQETLSINVIILQVNTRKLGLGLVRHATPLVWVVTWDKSN